MSTLDVYREAVDYIESFSNSSIRKNYGKQKKDPSFFLERTKYFLGLLGNPEKGFRYIHVTGTAGKGTVTTMLHEVLIASGIKAGLFTSPYVTVPIEKIKVGQEYIDPKEFVALVECLKPFIAEAQKSSFGAPSAFEIYFVLALLYFKQQECTWVVLEVGLGGRYDATNVIAEPVVTVITNIDYDHTEILGKTLIEIASDKMGIIKKSGAFFTSEQRPQILKMLRKQCVLVGAKFHSIDYQQNYSLYNTELVKSISVHLRFTDANIQKGIANTRLPCRFEIIGHDPLIVLDGAHNRAKMRSTVFNVQKQKFKKIYIILAIADTNKDKQKVFEPLFLLPQPICLILTQVRSADRRSVSPNLLLSMIKGHKRGKDVVEIIEDAGSALAYAEKLASKDDMIIVTGSFFLAGELRKNWVSEEWILKHHRSFKD